MPEVSLMTLELTDKERDYLTTLLEARHREKLHELHHTDRGEYKTLLKAEIALIEELRSKLSTV
jgi:hypothetical protein